ncbi:MAG: hypothetical protein QXV22_00115 [Thermoplasmataceae archaeon]
MQVLVISAQSQAPPGYSSQLGLDVIFVIIILIVTRRLYRGINGTRFSYARVLRLPVIYGILTIFYSLLLPTQYIIYSLILIAMGTALGVLFGSSVKFFTRNQQVFYRRSPVIMSVWLAAFIARISVDFAFPNNQIAILVVTLLLSVTTGIIIGEAFHLITQYRRMNESGDSPLIQDQNS